MGTDAHWEHYGAHDPYFGVLTEPRFRRHNLDAHARAAFFASGEARIAHVLGQLERLHGEPPRCTRALDFGCGVGRLLLPLSRRCGHVTGLDVSPSMLQEARRNCAEQGVDNVSLLRSDDRLGALAGTQFDLIVSDLVFQHIPRSRGRRILSRLLDHLAPGGCAVLGFTYEKTHRFGRARALVGRMPLARRLHDRLRGHPVGLPPMEMNAYPLPWLLQQLQRRGAGAIRLESGRHDHSFVVTLYFRQGS